MKKIFLFAIVVFAVFSASVSAINAVSVEFTAGDDILIINGAKVQVERPYISGSGTTMVPLRVISEAFGAKVEWNDAEQEIALSYGDCDINLKIGSRDALVNGKPARLEQPPVLSMSGTTMVPLRFISEAFGADVGWEDATGRITVTKSVDIPEQTVGADDIKYDEPKLGISLVLPDTIEAYSKISGGSHRCYIAKNRPDKYVTASDNLRYEQLSNSSYVRAFIYGSKDELTAQAMSDYEYDIKNTLYDKDKNEITEVVPVTVGGITGYMFTVTTSGTIHSDGTAAYLYMDNGEFVNKFIINSSVSCPLDIPEIIENIRVSTPVSPSAGTYQMSSGSAEYTAEKLKNVSFMLPDTFAVYVNSSNNNDRYIYGTQSSVRFTISYTDLSTGKISHVYKDVERARSSLSSAMDGKSRAVLSATGGVPMGNTYGAKCGLLKNDGDTARYIYYYWHTENNIQYCVTAQFGEKEDPDVVTAQLEQLFINAKW